MPDNDLIRRGEARACVRRASDEAEDVWEITHDSHEPFRLAEQAIGEVPPARITYEDAVESAELPGEWRAVNDWRQERRYSDKVHGAAEQRRGARWWLVWQDADGHLYILANVGGEPCSTLAEAQAACDRAALEHLPMSALLKRRGEG